MDIIWIIALAVVAAILLAAWWVRHSLLRELQRPKDDQSLALLQNQVNALTRQVAQSMSDTRKSMDDRLDGAARVIQGVSKQLGQLDESSKRMLDVGKDIADLQNILRSPKLRGNISELILGDLLSQILPSDHFELQHAFRGGEIVDAVVTLKAGMVAVDAKFPLENFRRVVQATNDEERKTMKKAFTKDVKVHVDAIAKKYIRPDEGTFDFALMYVPAENVYYETIIRDEDHDTALFEYALARRVIPVSPNSFYAYLQTILLGLKGLRIEESAREILNQIGRLNTEFVRFNDAFRLIGKHLENASKQFQDADKRREKVEGMVQGLDTHEQLAPLSAGQALPEPQPGEVPTIGK
ncbi:MAG: DNA recombination protein RmuC [bacterium]